MQRLSLLSAPLLLVLGLFSAVGSAEAGIFEKMVGSWWNKPAQEPSYMKVLVVHDQPGVVLEVKGKYRLYDPHTQQHISTRFVGKRKFIQPLQDGLKWGEEFPGVHQIRIIPDDAKTTTLVDGTEYRGNVTIYDIGGGISVVNEVPLEDYLKVLLVPQYTKPLPAELAAAIAIAARTQAWHQLQTANNRFWTVDANSIGYQGHAAAARDGTIGKAIDQTKNMVLVRQGVPFSTTTISLEEGGALAKQGKDAVEILRHFFPDSTVAMIETD